MKGSGRNKSFLIYAYEDPDNKIAYVGLTVDLKNRHSKHKCGCVRHGVRRLDVVGKYFQTIGKPLPNPIIKIEDLYSQEDAQYFENWYRELYEINGWTVLNIAKTGIGKSSIGGSHRKWTEKTIKDEIKRLGCVSRWEFGVKNESAYQAAHSLWTVHSFPFSRNNARCVMLQYCCNCLNWQCIFPYNGWSQIVLKRNTKLGFSSRY